MASASITPNSYSTASSSSSTSSSKHQSHQISAASAAAMTSADRPQAMIRRIQVTKAESQQLNNNGRGKSLYQ
jgi:hypothetical protein